jgi:hypothetical protein
VKSEKLKVKRNVSLRDDSIIREADTITPLFTLHFPLSYKRLHIPTKDAKILKSKPKERSV